MPICYTSFWKGQMFIYIYNHIFKNEFTQNEISIKYQKINLNERIRICKLKLKYNKNIKKDCIKH